MSNLLKKIVRWRNSNSDSSGLDDTLDFRPSTHSLHDRINDLPIVSLDFETTGLDLINDDVVSIGLIELKGSSIDLSTAWHQIINPKRAMTESSVAIHNISDAQVKEGISIEEALPILMNKINGKILLVHCQSIESAFLTKYFNQYYHESPVFQFIDTMDLAKRYGNLKGRELPGLRLYHLHEYYGMPPYKAHNALMDAITTAEVFMAQVNDYFNAPHHTSKNYRRKNVLLKDIIYTK